MTKRKRTWNKFYLTLVDINEYQRAVVFLSAVPYRRACCFHVSNINMRQ
ncbi:hypothetical protein PUN28_002317 [Cardiocondyla obscurior]|uniref:Uncharacterized protein n=1 Tax=Cardiocondyla obscurior TaxID=286306 RepID=A0AAW2GTN1_9HYME